jgi:SAM-dependent methyltransferase
MIVNELRAAAVVVRRSPIAPLIRRIRHRSPLRRAARLGRSVGWDVAAEKLLSPAGAALIGDPAFHEPLRTQINEVIDIELLLTALRRRLLSRDTSTPWPDEHLELLASLIQQCINNEWVWYAAPEELELVAHGMAAPGGGPTTIDAEPDPLALARLAMYRRPERVFASAAAREALRALSPVVRAPLERYLDARAAEDELKASIRVLGEPTSEVSDMIAENYEEYPYPRWLQWHVPDAGSRLEKMADFFSPEELRRLEGDFDVLFAGCGTGAKAITYSIGYGPRARPLAIDLSRASLAYAKRMAKEHAVENLDFGRMDLLALPKLGRSFDIVECSGVLHHLADPLEGLRALASVLEPGGFAHISLYSELSRRELVRLRQTELHRSTPDTRDGIRAFRWKLMHDDPESIDRRLPLRADFFDLNRCRDLLFHPVEHRYSVRQVGELVRAAGLEFRGFEAPPPPRHEARLRYPKPEERASLERWQEFDERHPMAFENLYEIWAWKPPA